MGSGGTLAGVAAYFNEQSGGSVACYGVEPDGCAVLAGHDITHAGHRIQGKMTYFTPIKQPININAYSKLYINSIIIYKTPIK